MEEEPAIRKESIRQQEQEYIIKTMGRIQLHDTGPTYLLQGINMQLKQPIQITAQPLLGVISVARLTNYTVTQEFQFIYDFLEKKQFQSILFDVTYKTDLPLLNPILRKYNTNSYMFKIRCQAQSDSRDSMFNSQDHFCNQSKTFKNQQKIDQIWKQKHEFDTIITHSQFRSLKQFDNFILIPFEMTFAFTPAHNIYLANYLIDYIGHLPQIILILPLKYPIRDLIKVLSIVVQKSNGTCETDFVQIEQLYSKLYDRIHFVVRFGFHPQIPQYLMNNIQISKDQLPGLIRLNMKRLIQIIQFPDHLASAIDSQKLDIHKRKRTLSRSFTSMQIKKDSRAVSTSFNDWYGDGFGFSQSSFQLVNDLGE